MGGALNNMGIAPATLRAYTLVLKSPNIYRVYFYCSLMSLKVKECNSLVAVFKF
jgi:hypothetical protein